MAYLHHQQQLKELPRTSTCKSPSSLYMKDQKMNLAHYLGDK